MPSIPKRIKLTMGYYALVDADDYLSVACLKWKALVTDSGQVYALCSGSGRDSIGLMHRFLFGATKEQLVDHKNRNGLDNRRRNLRICTRVQNVHNSIKSRGSSGYRGVSYRTKDRKWVAQIVFRRNHYYLGAFNFEEDAKAAYDTKKRELLGEFTPV